MTMKDKLSLIVSELNDKFKLGEIHGRLNPTSFSIKLVFKIEDELYTQEINYIIPFLDNSEYVINDFLKHLKTYTLDSILLK